MIIKNAKIVTSSGLEDGEVEIENGKITRVGKSIVGEKAFDARGLVLMPGGVDNHVHIEKDYLKVRTDDTVEESTIASLFGGTTTVVDFSFSENFYSRVNKFQGRSYVNFHFHVIANSYSQSLEKIKKDGFETVKFFTIPYANSPPGNMGDLASILEKGFSVMVHAEDWDLISTLISRMGKGGSELHLKSRPEESEISMALKISYLARMYNSKVLIAHVSSPQTLEIPGLMYEGTLHHIFLDPSYYSKENGYLYVTSPPARGGMTEKVEKFDMISTDHNWFNRKTKEEHKYFPDLVPGLPTVELRLPMMLTYFVKKGLPLWKAVEMNSINPAKFNNLKTGEIKEGYSADIILYDFNEKWIINSRELHMADWTPFEGFEILGKVRYAFLNGELALDNGELLGVKGRLIRSC
ncbi:hypothetical protein CM19_04180 [Candidatus Acidianus copahuensis]|uniref:Amidohydrolase-related domain-containing protein n=1 Tax=Candidatus Acidianus copahuensis TaxID=1160895 RepID=A0A031LPN5_9CREN|nr:amidohydrolase family protein [Candidatus Acidianus copahuensis]EZQ10352.1 hypothetical protein CM19_04180 [Candidatus Acidianus copahuensis]